MITFSLCRALNVTLYYEFPRMGSLFPCLYNNADFPHRVNHFSAQFQTFFQTFLQPLRTDRFSAIMLDYQVDTSVCLLWMTRLVALPSAALLLC